MTIEEIRKLSLEYAKGHVKTGPTYRTPKKKHKRRAPGRPRNDKETYAEWFARSLVFGAAAGEAPTNAQAIERQTDAYKHQAPGDDGIAPWD